MKEESRKKIGLTTILTLVILLLISLIFYIGYQKNRTIEVEATVQKVYQGNILVVDESGTEYKIPCEEEYNIGDKISFIMKGPNTKKDIVEGEVIQLETKSKTVPLEEKKPKENSNQETTTNSISPQEETTSQTNSVESESIAPAESTEEAVITYLNDLESQVNSVNTTSITSSIKSGFITIVDFLFYDGTIQGKKFSELSENAKLKVLKIAFSIDSKLEEKFPNYKEEIQSTSSRVYTNVKSKIIETYLNISTDVCQNNTDVCQSAKEGLGDLKKSFSLTWNFIKEISGVGLTKLKSWYEIWRESE